MTLLVVKQEHGKATLLADRAISLHGSQVATTCKIQKGTLWGRDFFFACTGVITIVPSMRSILDQMRKTFAQSYSDDIPLPLDAPELYLDVLVKSIHTLVLAHVIGAEGAGVKLDVSANLIVVLSGQAYIYDIFYLSPIKLTQGYHAIGSGSAHALTLLEVMPDINMETLFKSVSTHCQVSPEFDTVVDTVWK